MTYSLDYPAWGKLSKAEKLTIDKTVLNNQ